MTALTSYFTGTISVTADGTTVTGTSTLWLTAGNVKPGDFLQSGHFGVFITDIADDTHLTITPWPGSTLSGATYAIWKVARPSIVDGEVAKDVNKAVSAWNTTGFFVFVGTTQTVPDPSLGDDGQYAFQPTTGKTWVKSSGVWSYLGIYKGFNFTGAYNGSTTYSVGDVMTDSGSSYVWINPTPGSGHTAPNATYWQLLASIGNTGPTGATGAAGTNGTNGTNGASYGGTSTTSLTIGTGSKAFTTQSGLAYTNGARVRASSAANTSNWMEGLVTYSSTTLTITVDKTNGSGTFADWNFNVVGQPGAGDLSSANNLSDVASAETSRANLGIMFPPQGRLTLATGVPVMTTTQSAKTTIYYTPYVGNQIPIYNGSKIVPTVFAELSVATTDTTKNPAAIGASKVNDWFVWNDSGTLRLSHGPDWTNDTTRSAGTALVMVNGILLNSVAITNGPGASRGTYVGTTRSNGSSQLDWIFGGISAGGTAGFFGVWNAYNRVNVSSMTGDSTASWNYASTTVRAANNSSTIRHSYVIGLAEDPIEAFYNAIGNGTAGTVGALVGIGHDATNAYATGCANGVTSNSATSNMPAKYAITELGFHFVSACEAASAATTVTYLGTASFGAQSGLFFSARM